MLKKILAAPLLCACFSCGQNTGTATAENSTDSIASATALPDTLQQTPPKGTALHLADFIPAGYTILDTTSGDLNLDAYTDLILVVKKNGEDSTSDAVDRPEKRPLFILLGQPDQTYQLAGHNDNAVYCVNCGGVLGDPFTGVTVKKGYFSVEHTGGSSDRWTRIITFKYSPDDNAWYLFKDGGDNYSVYKPEKVKTSVKTSRQFGKVRFDQFNIYEE